MIRMPRQARNERKEDLKKVIAGCWLVLVFPHRDHHLLHVAGQVAEMRECAPRRPGVIARVETRRTCRARNPRFILQSSSCSSRACIGKPSFSFMGNIMAWREAGAGSHQALLPVRRMWNICTRRCETTPLRECETALVCSRFRVCSS
jgi:hypothetical protein